MGRWVRTKDCILAQMGSLKHQEVTFHHRVKAFQWVAQIHRLIVFVAFQVVVQRIFTVMGLSLISKVSPFWRTLMS